MITLRYSSLYERVKDNFKEPGYSHFNKKKKLEKMIKSSFIKTYLNP